MRNRRLHLVRSQSTSGAKSAGPALIVTADADLLDHLLRLGAAASVDLDVAADVSAIFRSWSRAALVLVGEDQLEDLVAVSPPRRSDVIVVCALPVGASPHESVWRHAVSLGAEHVVLVPEGEAWLVDHLADAGGGGSREGTVIAFRGSRGGAGTSTLAAAVALAASNAGLSTVLIDADRESGGIDCALGIENVPGLRWPELSQTAGRVAAGALGEVLPVSEGVSVLSWTREATPDVARPAALSVLEAASRGFDLVVVDLPRASTDFADEVVRRAHHVFLVVPREVRSVASAARAVEVMGAQTPSLSLVTRGPSAAGIDSHSVADLLQRELVADVRTESWVAAAIERGDSLAPRGSLAKAAKAILSSIDLASAVSGLSANSAVTHSSKKSGRTA